MKETVTTILNAKKSSFVELITASIYSLQTIFHQLMIVALLQSDVAEVKWIQHPVAHLTPHVESMKETVITILNAKKSSSVELITVSIYYLQIIFHQLMIVALIHNAMVIKSIHGIVVRQQMESFVEKMKETVTMIWTVLATFFVEQRIV